MPLTAWAPVYAVVTEQCTLLLLVITAANPVFFFLSSGDFDCSLWPQDKMLVHCLGPCSLVTLTWILSPAQCPSYIGLFWPQGL